MASLPFVSPFVVPLESGDDVDQLDNESDSDEEPEKVYRHYSYTYWPFVPVSERLLLVCSLYCQESENQEERPIAV